MVVGCGKEPAPPAARAPEHAPAAAPAAPPPAAPAAANPIPGVNQIQIGMTSEQVRQIMGAPGQIKQEGSELEWKYYSPQGKVEVKLLNNLVTAIERK